MRPGRIVMTATAVLGMAPSAIAATGGEKDTSDLVIWGFLGFCALIVVGQLLPLVTTLLDARKTAQKEPEALAVSAEGEKPQVVFEEE